MPVEQDTISLFLAAPGSCGPKTLSQYALKRDELELESNQLISFSELPTKSKLLSSKEVDNSETLFEDLESIYALIVYDSKSVVAAIDVCDDKELKRLSYHFSVDSILQHNKDCNARYKSNRSKNLEVKGRG